MPIVTLTTDFGEKDHYVGAVKGAIYSELESLRIVDGSPAVEAYHFFQLLNISIGRLNRR